MNIFIITFEKLDELMLEQMLTAKIKPGYDYLSTHIIFYYKMDVKFMSKAYFVANGHKMDASSSITYLSVVSRDIVRIDFLNASFNDLDIFA